MEDNCRASSVSIKLDMEDGDASSFSGFKWTKADKKSRKLSVQHNTTQLVNEFITQVSILEKHIFVKKFQNIYYNSLRGQL